MINYISVKHIINKIKRDFKIDNFNLSDIIEWIGESLEAIGNISLTKESIAIANVKNYLSEIPENIIELLQIGKLNNFNSIKCLCDDVKDIKVCSCDDNCNIIVNFEISDKIISLENILPIQKSTSTIFSNCENNFANCNLEYKVIDDKIRYSFKEGVVLIAYNEYRLDKDGFPTIPDLYSVKTAIEKYIILKFAQWEFYNNKPNSINKYQLAEQQWQKYCKQASNELAIPKGIDDMENIKNMWKRHITGRYYDTFFTTINKSQNLK